ncbi:hypothetical protein HMPREF1417_01390 [Helicobacter pylori GAM260Bi]|nr:hypothetical protein [Helicobacter pylori]EMH18318.1 hypothetical protein HMPREF1417_01390 [Helicobacter pylori GAM260Bi]EMH70217.1 hypothetical protein HMPREF1452_01452 [Helicobacter pylori HP260Bi]
MSLFEEIKCNAKDGWRNGWRNGWEQGECMKRSKNGLVCVCHTSMYL